MIFVSDVCAQAKVDKPTEKYRHRHFIKAQSLSEVKGQDELQMLGKHAGVFFYACVTRHTLTLDLMHQMHFENRMYFIKPLKHMKDSIKYNVKPPFF